MDRALIVVAKRPSPGSTKTRLVPPLSPKQAARLYRCMLLDTLEAMQQVSGVDHVVAYAPDEARAYFGDLAPSGYRLVPQSGETLGERLDTVLRAHLENGYAQAVVMNSDGPTLPIDYVQQAFEELSKTGVDAVLGPSEDGGYYLIGLKSPCSRLFDVTMSTATVLEETLSLARELQLQTACLPIWHDVDTPDQLQRFVREVAELPADRVPHSRRLLGTWTQQQRL